MRTALELASLIFLAIIGARSVVRYLTRALDRMRSDKIDEIVGVVREPQSMPTRAEMQVEHDRLHAFRTCHDKRCPGFCMHRCHDLDCEEHH